MHRTFVVVVLMLVASACATAQPAPAHPTAPSRVAPATQVGRYVALGDSYTAAPYVPLTDVAHGCLRSDHDYPALLAARLRPASFADVSCSGATVSDLTHRQRRFGGTVPPQLDAVDPATELVTIGIGGNDDDLFATLAAGCPVTGPNGVRLSGGRSCGHIDVATARRQIATVGAHVRAGLRQVHRRAPRAQVVLVGYPRLVATDRRCPARLPMSWSSQRAADRLTRRLDQTLAAAARATRTTYVDMYAASKGHDICSATPWVNGVHTDTHRALALHPYAAEQRAVARLIARQVG